MVRRRYGNQLLHSRGTRAHGGFLVDVVHEVHLRHAVPVGSDGTLPFIFGLVLRGLRPCVDLSVRQRAVRSDLTDPDRDGGLSRDVGIFDGRQLPLGQSQGVRSRFVAYE